MTNEQMRARRAAAVPRGVSSATDLYAERAEGSVMWDVEGKRYVDFASGIAVLNVGHRHPKVIAAIEVQLAKHTHPCFQVMAYEPYLALAERLNALAPGGPNKTIFVTTGAEALENAVKIAKTHTGRSALVAFSGGYHGRTLLTLALTGKYQPYKVGFGPYPSSVYHVPYPMEYRGWSGERSLEALELLFNGDVAPDQIAAIVIEPVLGEGGFCVAPFDFMVRLRELCDLHGIVLIVDEVQSGFCRTGKTFAIEHSGVVPDLITVAKSLGGGLPLAGVIGRAAIMDAPAPGGLGGTFGGNPVSCAAGLAVLDVIEEENLNERAIQQGERMRQRIGQMAERPELACIGDIRGLGGMIAVELVKDRTTKVPAPELAKLTTKVGHEQGIVLLSCGLYGNVLRLLAPLNTPDALLDEGLSLLESSLIEAVKRT